MVPAGAALASKARSQRGREGERERQQINAHTICHHRQSVCHPPDNSQWELFPRLPSETPSMNSFPPDKLTAKSRVANHTPLNGPRQLMHDSHEPEKIAVPCTAQCKKLLLAAAVAPTRASK